ncbi:atrial natriuretic peptide receptor 1-like [Paramacrobiotus metropolitanus]|uniref:atrial natriuretic peptide receptor 1-like n=1 Tax=Paramacrobiotus metropolitanus TaxID=2943436 RepID=UPI002445C1DC|nr:atrial natriuretic peptide receptor 1-like [Paramacrobiotus metropolitanus]XP_055346999.1 atrial natriuretic peptide receptor 1-like [Paramacrobiotus metropolitanus]XP_055347000.1 atrial natriuretic peptide receptor 1-like [Paramacrobiotus metropolitanus]XP_055347001.1 atrial natriuretic peptide receptor 1-like [Paramacrobiotus metropolitanus]
MFPMKSRIPKQRHKCHHAWIPSIVLAFLTVFPICIAQEDATTVFTTSSLTTLAEYLNTTEVMAQNSTLFSSTGSNHTMNLTALYGEPSTDPLYNVTVGVILTIGTTTSYDYDILKPAIEAAFSRARHDYSINFQPRNYLYEVVWWSDISPDPRLAKTQGCWMWNASGESAQAVNESVDVIVGPACTKDMQIVNQLTTYFNVPTVTGAANYVDSTAEFPFLTRCGFSTADMWTFFLTIMDKFQWKHASVIYDYDDKDVEVTFTSLSAILRNHNKVVFEKRLNATEFDNYDIVPDYLRDASINSRVIVILLKGALFRYFMIESYRLGMSGGDYVFVTTDLFLDGVVTRGNQGHWRQRDGYDREALKAYANLLVLTLKDYTQSDQYLIFYNQIKAQDKAENRKRSSVINYYSASFYDSILMLALAIRKFLAVVGEDDMDINDNAGNAKNVTLGLWNTTFHGASGNVHINPEGDRTDDLSLYYMTNPITGTFSVVSNYYGYNHAYEEVSPISWRTADGQTPLDEPLCGYENDKCPDTTTPAAVAGSIGSLLVLIGLISGLVLFIKARREAKASNSVWIAEWDDLQSDHGARTGSSRMSMMSGTTASATSGSKTSMPTSEGSSQRTRTGKPPPSSGKLFFTSWQGRPVMVRLCEKHRVHLDKRLLNEVKVVRNMIDDNLLRFIGAVLDPEHLAVIGEYCSKGSLQDLLANESFKLDWIFRYALINDIIKGVSFIHQSPLIYHGRLNSGCCYVDGKFVLKVGDYGLPTFYEKRLPREMTNEDYKALFWTAPELLRDPYGPGTQEGDTFAFAIILQEIILREEPYAMHPYEPKEIVGKIKKTDAFRPRVTNPDCPATLSALMERCWSGQPLDRPKFPEIKTSMKAVTKGDVEKSNLVDLIVARMEQYTADLEEMVEEKTKAFLEEKKKADALLNQILPQAIADRLKRGETVPPEAFDSATIFFSDIVGFAAISMESSPIQIVDFLNDLYSLFDSTIPKFDVYKVETIHDSYMVASGLPRRNGLNHAKEQAGMALALMDLIHTFKIRHRPGEKARLRVGLNSGPVVASVIGLAVPRYCLFGDTVNTASRMESTGEGLRIQMSPSTKTLLDSFGIFVMEDRGEIEVKGKGKMRTFWLIGQLSA